MESFNFDKFKEGDIKALEDFYLIYKNLMYFVISNYVRNRDDIEDLVNDCYIKCVQTKEKVKKKKSFKQYVLSICKNTALEFLKKQERVVLFENIENLYSYEDKSNAILTMLEPCLSNIETIVVYYKVVFAFKWKEITALTGIPDSSARLIFNTAIKKLKSKNLR